MKPKPKNTEELRQHGSESEDLLNFLLKYWDGLDLVKPKGYEEFCKGYCDFDGMTEWQDNERGKQEDCFNGFDDGDDGINFVSTVSLPHIAYDDLCQGRSPSQMLISSCISYGFSRGFLYGEEKGNAKTRQEIITKINKFMCSL